MSGNTITVTDETFGDAVLASDKPVLVDFWADWCVPCKMVSPVLEEIAASHAGRLTIAKLDVDSNPLTQREYQVMSMPTLMLFADGKPVKSIVGAKSKSYILGELDGLL